MTPKALILLAAAAFVMTGCSSEVPGQAATKSDLDLSEFADDPCRLFNADELNAQDVFKEPKLAEAPEGPRCTWDPEDSKRPAYLATLSTKGKNLEALKEKSKSDKTFRETTVAGLPAFINDSGQARGTCTVTFRASDTAAVVVRITSEFPGNPEYTIMCDLTEKLAGRVVEKLRA